MRTIPGWVGSGRLTYDYNAISVQLQLELPTGTELGNIQINFPNHTESIPQDVDDF